MYCGKFKNFLQREFLDRRISRRKPRFFPRLSGFLYSLNRRLFGCNGSILGWRLTQTPYN